MRLSAVFPVKVGRLFTKGVDALVRRQTDMRIVAQAANGREAIEQFAQMIVQAC